MIDTVTGPIVPGEVGTSVIMTPTEERRCALLRTRVSRPEFQWASSSILMETSRYRSSSRLDVLGDYSCRRMSA